MNTTSVVEDIIACKGVIVVGREEYDAADVFAGIIAYNVIVIGMPEVYAIVGVADIIVRDYTIFCCPKFYTNGCIG